ncbi:MAG: chloride channel protein [Myxococcales bacterium]|nr:chloride channel protein [Myxococcales bacterium]MCB9578183.1 chloride channel protein [Polyangiaceae bacterium]
MRKGLPGIPTLADLGAFARLFEFRAVSRWVGLGLVIGVVAGLGAAAFYVGMDWIRHTMLGVGAHMPPLEPHGEHSLFGEVPPGEVRKWVMVLSPALGGLISGLIVFRFAPEAEGHGTDALIESFHRHGGRIRPRVPIVKALASVVLIGTGGSAGREGPIAQIGAGFGSVLGSALKLSARERRLMLIAGAAGGIGAIFRTPLGAALFLVEVLYKDDFEVDALVPAVLSSVVAYSVFTMLFGEGTIFVTEKHYSFDPRQLPLYMVMAVFAALVGWIYIKVFYGMRDRVFHKLKMPNTIKPMFGGLAVGLLALAAPQALGASYGWLQEALLPRHHVLPIGWIGAGTMLGIALLKVLTTSLSVSSGGSGGVFGPSVVVGGMIGGAFGFAFHEWFPHVVPQPGAFVIVGMACFFGGVAHVPISSLVMASEMTGSYDLLVPLMLAEVVTFTLLRRFTLYEKQVGTRRDSPAHGAEYVLDLLQHVRVGTVFDKQPVKPLPASTPLAEVLRVTTGCNQTVFPVVGPRGELSGIVTLDTVRAFFFDEEMGKLAIAADCAMPLVTVTQEDTLAVALERFASSHYPELPVVDSEGGGEIVGMLSYEQLLHTYSQELVRRRSGIDESGVESKPAA